MPRPRTPVGSHGTIKTDEIQPGLWRARTLYRGADGKRRQIERVRRGKTSASAVQAVKAAVVGASTRGDGDVHDAMTVRELAESFLAAKRGAGLTAQSLDTYQHALNIIVPGLGELALVELTPGRLQRFLDAVLRDRGPGAAKGCRSVLSGMLGMAVRNDVLRSNPVASLERIRKGPSRAASAIPLDEVARFRAAIRGDAELQRLDMVDLWDFMLFTGCRIGEALALRWTHVDLVDGTVTFSATVSRASGQGAKIQEHRKTESSSRTISVPTEVVEMLTRRRGSNDLVFPSMLGRLRDASNTEADWRANRERLGYPMLTSHAFRKTVATALDTSGMSARAIAEYLGHKRPSMTQDVYMSRTTGTEMAAVTLGGMFGVSSESRPVKAVKKPRTGESYGAFRTPPGT